MTPAEFKDRYPTFVNEPDSRIQLFLDDASASIDQVVWGTYYSRGLAALTAHLLVLSSDSASGSGSSAKVSKKVGDLTTTYSEQLVITQSKNPLYRTTFGQIYLRLAKSIGSGAIAV